jgi:hypothetical protein
MWDPCIRVAHPRGVPSASTVVAPVYCACMSLVRHLSRGDLEARRDVILREHQLTRAELQAKVDAGKLVGDEWAAWAEITEIEYLLVDE